MAKSIYNEFHIRYNAECRHIEEQSKVSHAIRLANEKYCGMLQMIGKIAPVSHEISIVSSETVEVFLFVVGVKEVIFCNLFHF
jgi:putative redox protein